MPTPRDIALIIEGRNEGDPEFTNLHIINLGEQQLEIADQNSPDEFGGYITGEIKVGIEAVEYQGSHPNKPNISTRIVNVFAADDVVVVDANDQVIRQYQDGEEIDFDIIPLDSMKKLEEKLREYEAEARVEAQLSRVDTQL